MDDNAPQQGPASTSRGSPPVLSRRFGAAFQHSTRLFRRGEGQSSSRVMAGDFVSIGWPVFGVIFGKLWLRNLSDQVHGKGALTPMVISDAKCLAVPSLDDKAEESWCGRRDALTDLHRHKKQADEGHAIAAQTQFRTMEHIYPSSGHASHARRQFSPYSPPYP